MMIDYVCPSCGKNAKLPGSCCGNKMSQKETSNCNKCKAPADSTWECSDSPMQKS